MRPNRTAAPTGSSRATDPWIEPVEIMRIHVQIPLRWSDFDAYAHVNNAEMLRVLEEARIQAMWRPDDGSVEGAPTAVMDVRPGADTLALIARQEIEYLAPIPYMRAPLDIEMWAGAIGGGEHRGVLRDLLARGCRAAGSLHSGSHDGCDGVRRNEQPDAGPRRAARRLEALHRGAGRLRQAPLTVHRDP